MLHQNIKLQITEALRAHDTVRLNTLRGLNALFLNEMLTAKSSEAFLPDDKVIPLIKRSVKQHKDSIDQFTKGKREDLVVKEQAELKILETFLPPSMAREEIMKVVQARLQDLKAKGTFDAKAVGKLTGLVMKELAGKADGADVKAVIEEVVKTEK